MNVLVINTGSSSVKCSLLESATERALFDAHADWSLQPARLTLHRPGAATQEEPLPVTGHGAVVRHLLQVIAEREPDLIGPGAPVAAVGHRVVHGGPDFTQGVRITPDVIRRLKRLYDLAPLHNPVNVEGIEAAEQAWPKVPQVAVFDTAFHATMPPEAKTYAIPKAWTNDWGLRRYGFHGLSHQYCAGRAAEMLGRPSRGLRLVICHLGNGCSASAVRDGACQNTSMGFTPLEGLVMGTRSGSVDPGLLLYVLEHKGIDAAKLDGILNRESGLLGISGQTSDMRTIQEGAAGGDAECRLALDVFTHRLREVIGAMTASIGGVDALVFTAGVGENSAIVRREACRGLECLGLELDEAANESAKPDVDVARPTSRARILVIGTREDVSILRETVRVLADG
jgi:acetate kinase